MPRRPNIIPPLHSTLQTQSRATVRLDRTSTIVSSRSFEYRKTRHKFMHASKDHSTVKRSRTINDTTTMPHGRHNQSTCYDTTSTYMQDSHQHTVLLWCPFLLGRCCQHSSLTMLQSSQATCVQRPLTAHAAGQQYKECRTTKLQPLTLMKIVP